MSLSKIDRVLVCHGFRDRWPNATLQTLPWESWSDHCPLLLQTMANDFGPLPFRFFNSWLQYPGFDDLVICLCASFSFKGSADKRLATKLRWLKNGIKSWIGAERAKDKIGLRELEMKLA